MFVYLHEIIMISIVHKENTLSLMDRLASLFRRYAGPDL